MSVVYQGKTFSDEEVKNILERASEYDVANLLKNVDDNTRSAIVNSYNSAAGTNYTLDSINNWVGVKPTTTDTGAGYQAPTVPQAVNDLATKYGVTTDYLTNNASNIYNWWNNLDDNTKIAEAIKAGVSPSQLDTDIYNFAVAQGLTTASDFKSSLPSVTPQVSVDSIANKYGVTSDYLRNNLSTIQNNWSGMDAQQKADFAKNYGLTPEEVQHDITALNFALNGSNVGTTGSDVGTIAGSGEGKQIRQRINQLQNATQQSPSQITPPSMQGLFNYNTLQSDIYAGMKSQIEESAQKELEQLGAQTSKLGLFRSGLNLKLQGDVYEKSQKALAQAWSDASIQSAKLKAEAAMKEGDWQLATQMQNTANYLEQQKITNDMQLGMLNAQLQKYGIDTQTSVEQAKLQLEKYGIDLDTNTKYDLAALDYMKSMDLARADVMTRATTSYLQYNMDSYKQLLINKNYTEANNYWSNNIMPLLTAMLPTIIEFTGENPDAEQLQEAYQDIYGTRLDPETINKLIDDVNSLSSKVDTISTQATDYNYYA